ncbi:unnamed protein product [Coffea canephora]|uniref:DH200=94 genomic scaffold, scaffold_10036 n=1 Tax=Coffea canephora TaxID=49390 RepID=A0A068VN25_COFCA|nr:unnamed protein product [Coffea canephora]
MRSWELSNIYLAGCKLRGTLPNFTTPDSLSSLDLSDNYFTEGISNFFTRMTTLEQAKLSNNQRKSDVSAIKLPDGLSSIDFHSNQLYGTIPEFSTSLNLKVLNIASNKLTSYIPNSISNLAKVERLDISRNQIGGTIPTSLGLLLKLQWLDLSINTLSGKIPNSLLQIEALRHASFRANRLCSEIPQGRPLNIFPLVTYAHNLCLCGRPLPPCKGKK